MAKDIYAAQMQLLEGLRDIWPQQKGLAVLLFQNDLFRRIRRLEATVEAVSTERICGFLPDEFPDWKGSTPEYEAAWAAIESELVAGETEPLDRLEDEICAWCEDMIPDSLSFFDAALDTGELDEHWMEIAETLLDAEEPAAARQVLEVNEETKAPAPTPETAETNQKQADVIDLEPEPVRSRPTRRRRLGLPLTPSRVRRLVRQTRRHK